jgi:hypothetical protein
MPMYVMIIYACQGPAAHESATPFGRYRQSEVHAPPQTEADGPAHFIERVQKGRTMAEPAGIA